MTRWHILSGIVAAILAGAALVAHIKYRRSMSQALSAYDQVLGHASVTQAKFDPHQIDQLPEIARRYFRHAIAPGTPIYSAAKLQMKGSFLLGDRRKFQTYSMTARQALRPPDQFVWMPQLRSRPLTITGSDALVGGKAWTRFWMLGLVPVANEQSSPDLVRSAEFRAAVEGALWLPVSLLPENGAEWAQSGPDTADVVLTRFKPQPITLRLILDRNGSVREVVGQRWSNANPDKHFRLQSFGGAVLAEGTFNGLTIPTKVAVGNLYGTPDYLPFFQATLTAVKYR